MEILRTLFILLLLHHLHCFSEIVGCICTPTLSWVRQRAEGRQQTPSASLRLQNGSAFLDPDKEQSQSFKTPGNGSVIEFGIYILNGLIILYRQGEGYFVSLAFSYVLAAFHCNPGLSFQVEIHYDNYSQPKASQFQTLRNFMLSPSISLKLKGPVKGRMYE